MAIPIRQMTRRDEIQTITPKLAEQYLTLNKNIRKMSYKWVQFFTDTITRGEFVLTPDGICFDSDGNLINGQHRLAAIAEAGISVRMRVYYDVTPEEARAMDLGRKRALADVLDADRKVMDVMSLAARICLTAQFPVSVADTLYNGLPGEACTYLLEEGTRTTRAGTTVAPVKLAAVVHMLDGADWDETAKTYRALVLADVEVMPRVALAFTRQLLAGTATSGKQFDMLARAMAVFDPDRQGNTRIQVSDVAIENAREDVRRVIGPHINAKS